jgi:hypothetical protein
VSTDTSDKSARAEIDPELYRRVKVIAHGAGLGIREALDRFAGPGINAEYERQTLAEADRIKATRKGAKP